MYRVKACGITHRGKVKGKNEDALLIDNKILQEEVISSPLCVEEERDYFLFAVADGLGGHACGEMASLIVLKTLMEEKPKSPEDINMALHKARDNLEAFANQNPDCYDLGSAIAGLVLTQKDTIVFNVGDCRVYGIKDQQVERLTQDHTEVERLIRFGYITQEEAKHHPYRHVLTSALIGSASFREFEVFIKSVENYRSFLICSDGLWDMVEDHELTLPPSELISKALSRTATDNITFIRVDVA
ncbi:MAG: PP2C family protein-serine/threonine phosphatase [Hydrogenobacter sp.]